MRDAKENRIVLEHGAPMCFGAEGEKGVRLGEAFQSSNAAAMSAIVRGGIVVAMSRSRVI